MPRGRGSPGAARSSTRSRSSVAGRGYEPGGGGQDLPSATAVVRAELGAGLMVALSLWPPGAQALFTRAAGMGNPKFYEPQRPRESTWDTPHGGHEVEHGDRDRRERHDRERAGAGEREYAVGANAALRRDHCRMMLAVGRPVPENDGAEPRSGSAPRRVRHS